MKKKEDWIIINNYYSNKDLDNSFFIDLYSQSDTQREIIKSIAKDYFPYALQFLKERGIFIKDIIDDRDNEALIEDETDRFIHIGNILLEENRKIDTIEYELNMMFKNYTNEKDPDKREDIFKKMIAIRHYVSAYIKTLYDMMTLR